MKRVQADLALTAAMGTLGMFLLWTGRRIGARTTSAMPTSGTFENILGLAAAVVGIIVLAWWGLSFILAFTTGILWHRGHATAARVTGAMVPAPMKRLAILVLAFNLMALPAATASQPTMPSVVAAQTTATTAQDNTSTTATAEWSPSKGTAAHRQEPDPSKGTAGNRQEPDTSGPRESADDTAESVSPQWTPTRQAPDGGLLVKQQRPVDRSEHATAETVTVNAGDCLWDLAARQLGAWATDSDIAAQWQKWYAINKSTIGSNPDVLQPGTLLLPPPRP